MLNLNLIKYFIIGVFCFPNITYAYIDPGNLNVILQGLFATFAGALAFASLYLSKIKLFLLNIVKKIKSKKNDNKS